MADKKVYYIVLVVLVALLFWFSLPKKLFSDPLSTVVYDKEGELLGARIASDGQWRFPGADAVPLKYEKALIEFEDQYFRFHPGVNPISIGRAIVLNIRNREVVSGGSTITMQVMRMSRKGTERSIKQKLIESVLSLRYELTASKDEILQTYANNAPFGGNVVGIEAASWRYFGTDPFNLTWAESALLAVLPNSPSLIHPGKNRDLLLEKRNDLLKRLCEDEVIDSLTLALSLEEDLPDKPMPLPNLAPHLTDKLMLQSENKRFYSTISKSLQSRVGEMAEMRQKELKTNEIHNMACVVMEVESGNVLAYVGNTGGGVRNSKGDDHGNAVDVITSKRSTGSILKPFLFAGLLDNGSLLQTSLVPDVPIRYNGYAPKNYDRGYQGAVPAYEALARSLNIPSVILLKRYGVEPFLKLLRDLGFTSFDKSHEHYGLTLILGGAETSLWELAGVYGSMARSLNNYNRSNGNYFPNDYHMPRLQLTANSHIANSNARISGTSSIKTTNPNALDLSSANSNELNSNIAITNSAALGSLNPSLKIYGSDSNGLSRSTSKEKPPEEQLLQKNNDKLLIKEEGLLSASSIFLTFESLLEVNRPEELSLWYLMSSTRKIAWKTGTSYGYRDAWAVGVTPEYLVAVWAGNADGEGRPGLVGLHAAAPLMFDVFGVLPETSWFDAPLDDLREAVICKQSGYLAGPNCVETDTIQVVPIGLKSKPCPYHKIVHLNQDRTFRVNSKCYPVNNIRTESWFVLPPLMEWHYKRVDPAYEVLPPLMPECGDEYIEQLEIVYPQWDSHLVIPIELDGSKGKVILEVAHRNPNAKVFWHIDQEYVGTTTHIHKFAADIYPGKHTLTVVDQSGNEKRVRFEVLH